MPLFICLEKLHQPRLESSRFRLIPREYIAVSDMEHLTGVIVIQQRFELPGRERRELRNGVKFSRNKVGLARLFKTGHGETHDLLEEVRIHLCDSTDRLQIAGSCSLDMDRPLVQRSDHLIDRELRSEERRVGQERISHVWDMR